MIYGSLMVLAIGLLTSTTILALSHVLMIVPALYFLPRGNYKEFPKSAWALLAFIMVIILSVLANQDIAVKGLKPILKAKYFLFGFLSIAPLQWYFKHHYDEKKISWLIYAFFIATTIATISGLFGTCFGINPLLMKTIKIGERNGGLFGMVMNYAHNMSFFLIIIAGLILYRKKINHLISVKFLYFVFFINLIGLYFSYTRGAWLGLLIALPFLFNKWKLKKLIALFALLGCLGAAFYLSAGKKVIRPKSEAERISQWRAALAAFEERPLLGYGYLNFESHSVALKKRYGYGSTNFASHAHNNFLEILGSTGVMGFIAFLMWIFFWFTENFRKESLISSLAIPFLIVFLVGGLTQSTITLGINLFFIMAGWSISTAEGKSA